MMPKVKDKPKIIERYWGKVLTSPSENPMIWGAPVCLKTAGFTEVVSTMAVAAFDFHLVGAHGAGWVPCKSLHFQQHIKISTPEFLPLVHRGLFSIESDV